MSHPGIIVTIRNTEGDEQPLTFFADREALTTSTQIDAALEVITGTFRRKVEGIKFEEHDDQRKTS